MKKSFRLTCTLVEAALEGAAPAWPEDVSPAGWVDIYEQARRQTVQGIAFDGISLLDASKRPPEPLMKAWQAEVKAIEDVYSLVSSLVDSQRALWNRLGVNAELLKGLNSAAYYPIPSHRVNGDIDWWMHTPADMDKALEYLHSHGVDTQLDSDGDVNFKTPDGIVTELHRKGLEEDGIIGTLLLLNAHVLHHAAVFGAGLRHICDYHLALRRYDGAYDRQQYEEVLRRRGMLRWTRVLETLPEAFLSMVERDGNFGFSKARRSKGLLRRTFFFLMVAPGPFFRIWAGLAGGRLKRK